MKRQAPESVPGKIRAHLLIVESRFYEPLADELVRGAIHAIEMAGATWERQPVPGVLEIPPAIVLASRTGRFDGYVALGAVLRGETTHYDIVANESARGLMELSLTGLCIGNGILTCENMAQAQTRARVNSMNKGGGAADACLHLIEIERAMKKPGRKA